MATAAACALALFNMAAFSSELKSFRGLGPGTFGPESTTGAGLGVSVTAGTSSATCYVVSISLANTSSTSAGGSSMTSALSSAGGGVGFSNS